MERILESQTIEGEIGIVIEYQPRKSEARQVLEGAMRLIDAIDKLDRCLLSSIDSSLEPVSILNDVQHSSLQILLARALRGVPDEHLQSMEWKRWIGGLLVRGKHLLLQKLDADAPEISRTLEQMEPQYRNAPSGLVGYLPPRVADVRTALHDIRHARGGLPNLYVTVQTELGDIDLAERPQEQSSQSPTPEAHSVRINTGIEFFKVKSTDMIGQSQWVVMRNGKATRVNMLHQAFLDQYQRRQHQILPGDSMECRYEETVTYDIEQNEIDRSLSIVEVLRVISPPLQTHIPM